MSSHCHPGLVNCSLQQFASCSSIDITINQASAREQPLGTPVFLVEIKNPGPSACTVSSVHFNCDSFSSDIAINPGIFKRVGDDDCLVNNGTALSPSGVLCFKYSASSMYPLSISNIEVFCSGWWNFNLRISIFSCLDVLHLWRYQCRERFSDSFTSLQNHVAGILEK